jgi:type I restriction enzyme S subunit
MAHFDGVCSNTTFVLEPQNETLSSKYLLYLMSTERFHQNSIALSKGSTNPYINFSDLANFEFVLPSLEEQTRVVELLSAVDEHAEALRHQLNVAIETRKSVLQNLLGRGGKGWTETTLGEAALVLMGQSPPGDSYNSAGLGLPFMQGSAEFGEHVPTPTLWCSEPAKIAEPGDLLISVRAPVGDTNFANQPIAIGRGLAIVRSNGIASTEFLRMTIQLGVEKLLAVSGGGMFSSITAKNLRSFAVSAPSLDEQERIVEEITKIDVLIEETSAALNSTKQLRTSLLNKEIA